TSGVDDWLRGKELNWKRAILSGLAGATLVGFASGAYPLVQPLINKATAAIEKHAGPVVAKIKPTIQNVDKCFGYQRTPRYFALIKFGNENFVECLYAQADRGGGSVDGVTRLEGRGKKYKTDDGALIAGKKVAEINNLPKYQTPTNNLDLDYVAEVRKKLGIPPLGNDKLLKDEGVLKAEQTVAVLQGDGVEIWGRNGWSADNKAEFKNMKSAWGKGSKAGRDGNKREKAGTNAQTWTHAEGDVFWYFYKYRKENQILGGKAKLVVDRPLCDSCGDQFKGVQNLMEEVGLDELIVVTPDNPNGIVYRPRPGMRRTTWKEAD
ncbi:hypothetical protein, partial [Laceyella tengchongensis]|uniref:hypothetical protein n=1 Tax=Laceyella tengchongensis TaxID=574699 RepID=UPI00188E46E9